MAYGDWRYHVIVVVAVTAPTLIDTAWRNHAAAEEQRAYARARADLAALVLPVELTRHATPSCTPGVNNLCAVCDMSPAQIEPMPENLLHGRSESVLCFAGPFGDPCPVLGEIVGYPVSGFATHRVFFVGRDRIPRGAVPVTPGSRAFTKGTDIAILIGPPRD